MRVEDVMTTDVMTVTPETPLKEAARMLVGRRISGFPVVRDGVVVGVVSETDVVGLERGDFGEGAHRIFRSRDRKRDVRRASARTVGDVMTSPAITVMPIWTVAGAAALMLDKDIKRLPVVRAEKLVGIVTRADIVRAFARSDEAIRREIADAMDLQQGLMLDDSPVAVTVQRGEALLTGTVHRRSQAERLPKVAEGVPGMVAVRSELDWSEDDE
jgi:CBS domain-containing protein